MTAKILISRLMENFFTKSLSFSLFAMPALVLTIRHGVNISAIPILLLSVIILIYRYPVHIPLAKKEKILIFSLLLLPAVIAFDVILRGINLRYLDYYLRFVLAILIFLALRKIKVSLTPLITGILMGSIGAGIFALYQKYYLHINILSDNNTLGHMLKINFGNISLLLGMMSLAGLFLIKETRFKKSFAIISILAFILGVTGSVLSGARGGWLAIPFFACLFIVYFPCNKKLKIFSVVGLILAILLIYFANSNVKSRIDLTYKNTDSYFSTDNLQADQTSTGTRLELWKAAQMMIIEQPIFGIGSGQFRHRLKEKIAAGQIKNINLYEHVHNETLQILVSTGIIGLLAYLILYAGSAYYFYRSINSSTLNTEKYLSFLGMMLVGAYFIFGLTNYSFGHHLMVLFFAVMMVIFAGMIASLENKTSKDG
ncbi:RfaL protein [methanotrophic bacterial endosymbiont of Bathymodiolus sp.]|nr:RfaL protein [methanotrophic bacterial endosymbiont of Bathymodiolus sp.]